MNMAGMSETEYRTLNQRLADAYEAAADGSMNVATSEVRAMGREQIQGNTVCNVHLMVHGKREAIHL